MLDHAGIDCREHAGHRYVTRQQAHLAVLDVADDLGGSAEVGEQDAIPSGLRVWSIGHTSRLTRACDGLVQLHSAADCPRRARCLKRITRAIEQEWQLSSASLVVIGRRTPEYDPCALTQRGGVSDLLLQRR